VTDSRAKGTRGEQAVATLYREQGIDCARVPNSGGLATKGDIVGVPGVHVEVKSTGRLRLVEWMEQAEREAPLGQTPAVHWRFCTRSKSTGWFVSVPFDDFVDLLKRANL
jgi:Holliday junction resolvase